MPTNTDEMIVLKNGVEVLAGGVDGWAWYLAKIAQSEVGVGLLLVTFAK